MRSINLIAGVLLGLSSSVISSAATPITRTAQARDFLADNNEFEIVSFSSQSPAPYFANNQNNKIEKGIVGPMGASLGVNGKPVYSSVREAGFFNTVQDSNLFDKWWQDVPGLNTPISVPLTFSDIGGGMYRYDNTNFFPIDGLGFGNEGYTHNYHYTIQLSQDFIYKAGQSILAASDDDMWIFIDKKLAIDLGGIHGGYQGSVSLDSLGLIPGQRYAFDLFYAERNTFGSTFSLQSDIIGSVPEPASCAVLAIGAAMLFARKRRR